MVLKLIRYIDYIILLLCGIIFIWSSLNINSGYKNLPEVLKNDARGYYAYLPALFIYKDAGWKFIPSTDAIYRPNKEWYFDFTERTSDDKVFNKYYLGTAVSQLPFFLIAHTMAMFFGIADGYSDVYMLSVCIAACFYALAGLFFLNLLLRDIAVSKQVRTIVLLVTGTGTQLFYYTVSEPGMSHVYSFAFVSAFLYGTLQYSRKYTVSSLVLSALVLGMIVLIRPVNVLICLSFPALLSLDNKNLLLFLRRVPLLHVCIFLICVSAILMLQFFAYYVQTGSFWIYAYSEEGFQFLNPQILAFLFSFRKGLFVYTPVCLISLLGLLMLYKQRKGFVMYYAGSVLFIVYILSSWWIWWYGGSFSSRPMTEYLPYLAIPGALALQALSCRRFMGACMVIFICILLNQVQTWQYRHGIIHWENMNRELYFDSLKRIS